MNFIELLTDSKTNSISEQMLIEMYKPLLVKEAIWNGVFDEDLYQELVIVLIRCIRTFTI